MDLKDILSEATGLASGLSSLFGDDVPKKKKAAPYNLDAEMRLSPKRSLDGLTTREVVLQAAKEGNIDPSLLFSSAYQEGLNKAIFKPGEVSEAYNYAGENLGLDKSKFPVDGFYAYGLDTFGNNFEKLKKYLPEDFKDRFFTYEADNEKGEAVKTAAFKSNKDALIAKAAMMNLEKDNVLNYAKEKGIELDDKAKDYFMLAAYNGGFGRGRQMIDEYAKSKDKSSFIDKGETTLKEIHKNIYPRLTRKKLASELLADDPIVPIKSPNQMVVQ